MSYCKHCGDKIYTPDQDLYNELCRQADALGMESLTENQQMLVNQDICEECYDNGYCDEI
ncbi:MAG TPA: hypothetical protein VIK86_07785 [Candidatus Paceibacterota bacterium]